MAWKTGLSPQRLEWWHWLAGQGGFPRLSRGLGGAAGELWPSIKWASVARHVPGTTAKTDATAEQPGPGPACPPFHSCGAACPPTTSIADDNRAIRQQPKPDPRGCRAGQPRRAAGGCGPAWKPTRAQWWPRRWPRPATPCSKPEIRMSTGPDALVRAGTTLPRRGAGRVAAGTRVPGDGARRPPAAPGLHGGPALPDAWRQLILCDTTGVIVGGGTDVRSTSAAAARSCRWHCDASSSGGIEGAECRAVPAAASRSIASCIGNTADRPLPTIWSASARSDHRRAATRVCSASPATPDRPDGLTFFRPRVTCCGLHPGTIPQR